jgi:hypothetical protein
MTLIDGEGTEFSVQSAWARQSFLSVVVVQRGMATSLTSYDFQKRRYRREKEMSVYIKDEEGVLHTPVQF